MQTEYRSQISKMGQSQGTLGKVSMKLIYILLLCVSLQVLGAQEVSNRDGGDLLVFDASGYSALQQTQLKEHPQVNWWTQLDNKIVLAVDPGETLSWESAPIQTFANLNFENLAVHAEVHCQHEAASPEVSWEKLISVAGISLVYAEKAVAWSNTTPDLKALSRNRPLIYRRDGIAAKAAVDADIQALVDQVDEDRWFDTVSRLAAFDRLTVEGFNSAADIWLEEMSAIGLAVDSLPFSIYGEYNIIAEKRGTVRPDDVYIVGAHLDSRNEEYTQNLPSPGAEDNASGCAGVLEIARVLRDVQLDATVYFMCYGAEERGLVGSRFHASHLENDGQLGNIKSMLNMDMISYRRNAETTGVIGTTEVFQDFGEFVADMGRTYAGYDPMLTLTTCCTDHMSYIDQGIPATTSQGSDLRNYPQYHTTEDLPIHVDPDLGSKMVKTNLAALVTQAGISSPIPANLVRSNKSGQWFNPEQSGHGLQLEILPDNRAVLTWYTYDETGAQKWLLGTGDYAEDQIVFDVIVTENGQVPQNFDAEAVEVIPWGQFTITFNDCNNAEFSWDPLDSQPEQAGSLSVQRLTTLEGLACEN